MNKDSRWVNEDKNNLSRFIPGAGRHKPRKEARELIKQLSKEDEYGCWIFHKEPNSSGYPYMNGYGPSHKVSFWAFKCPKGKVPAPLFNVTHECRNHRCVNPDHLTLRKDSMKRWSRGNA